MDAPRTIDRFVPAGDVVERHAVRVRAPASATWEAALEQRLDDSLAVRLVFFLRSVPARLLGRYRPSPTEAGTLLEQTKALGWGVLSETPGREVVMGAVTRPWEADVTFHALPPERFAAFDEPGWVKIAWTLEAEPLGDGRSRFRTETRAVATDDDARRRFRRYWRVVAPGVVLVRLLSLVSVRRRALRRARLTPPTAPAPGPRATP